MFNTFRNTTEKAKQYKNKNWN